jgi:stearoyl-CoA desaturase (delta-9 desaturase)
MSHFTLGLSIFFLTYLLNTFYISVLYHRGLAHGAVTLGPRMRKFVIHTGNWVTGMNPKAWCCMHRLHHIHSDTPNDPHSPLHHGVLGVMLAQLRSYEDSLRGLINDREPYVSISKDLNFPVHWMNRRRLWFLPYLFHGSIAVILGSALASRWVGFCYAFGLMSHPIQGWMVNALAHKFGYRNFSTPDNSKNNTLVAWLVMGEGFQNNHHFNPRSAKFSVRLREIDLGYGICLLAHRLRLLEILQPELGTLK